MDISQIEPNKKTLRQLFVGDNKTIIIPKYQRPFSWDETNAEKFFDDIFTNKQDSYFLGSILLNEKDGIYEVIDGQQRITTCSLFLFILFLYYKNISPEGGSEDILLFLKSGELSRKNNTLVLNRINNDIYTKIFTIQKIEELKSFSFDNDSNKNILNIVDLFYSKLLKDKINDNHLEKERVEKIFKYFSEKVFFISIISKDTRQASRLFEILNNRGADLTETDLVRNYLLLKSDEQNYPQGLSNWQIIEDKVGIDNLEQFFRYTSFLISNQSSIYERIYEYTSKNSSKSTIEFLLELVDSYLQINEPASFNESEESSYLENLNLFGVSQIRPILLAASKKFKKEDYLSLIKIFENFIFRYSVICGKNPNKIEHFSKDTSIKIFNLELDYRTVIDQIKDLDPKEEEFSFSFKNKTFKNNKVPRYIINKIEEKISTGDKGVINDSVHLEHIMPKKIDYWQKNDNYYTKEFHEKYLNNIGNMVLLHKSINTSIKNKIFFEKKNKYEGDINLLADIKLKKDWKESEILWNIERYFIHAKEIWKKLI